MRGRVQIDSTLLVFLNHGAGVFGTAILVPGRGRARDDARGAREGPRGRRAGRALDDRRERC
jgi:hypothetical protein